MGYPQDFFIEGRYLGRAFRKGIFIHAEFHAPSSLWFLCPVCGEMWAKCPVTSPSGLAMWEAVIRTCRKHGTGSIHRPWDSEFTEALPLAVLQWEFEREVVRQGLNYEL